MEYTTLEVAPVTGALGAEIGGVDLSQPLGNRTMSEIHSALLEHLVLFFRDQDMTPEQQIAFGRRFGLLHTHPFVENLDGYPEIIEIVKEKGEQTNWGEGWHSDVSYEEEPCMGSILYGREIPPYCGDTLFANMYLAYDALSEGMKQMLEGMRAVHTSGGPEAYSADYKSMRQRADAPEEIVAVHPVIRTHPETRRKLLYVNRVFTSHFEGMTRAESRPILEYLLAHQEQPVFSCRFRWKKDSVAFWDNRAALHHAVTDYHPSRVGEGFRRVMHRVTVCGDKPF